MVSIAPPPPQNTPSPSFLVLEPGSHLIRIFNPTQHGAQALTFRHYGPIHRFDHQRGEVPNIDSERGVYYAAFTLSGCLVECFGDPGVIEIKDEEVCRIELTRPITLLDLRGAGAMRAGSVSALAKTADRRLSQEWSRYFYEEQTIYSTVDGLIYFNAHNDEEAIVLYERAMDGLVCPPDRIIRLDRPQLRPAIQQAAIDNNLIIKP
jgi:hypothetical protein